MNVKAGVNFHNRFDIEVRDLKTGELKQKGQAENIILDRMYERLCNFNSYFDYIHFGQGTGTLDPSRNALFNKLGYKSATTEETIKAFPVSKWTRKITLNPEEYAGYKITEVGISDSSSYINTHALVKDAEGNPLSIDKTDTDVIVIYATVFVELQNKSENIYFTNLPNNNNLLNYLLGGSSPSSSYINLGKKWTKGNMLDDNIILSKKGTLSTDILNRKKIVSTRFGITEGNGPIAEITVFNAFNATLPEVGVFEKYALKDVNLGVGDSVKKQFVIPNIRAENIIAKVDNVISTDLAINEEANINFKLQNLTGAGSKGYGVSFSPDGKTIATASYSSSPYFTIHRLNTDTGEYEKLQDLTGAGDNGQGVSFSPDSKTVAAASYSSPYFTIHRLNTDTGEYEKLQDLTGAGDSGQGVSFSPDSKTIAAASYSSPYFTVHRLNTDTGEYEKLQDLTGAGNDGRGISFSPDGKTIATASYSSPYFTVHRLNTDTGEYEKLQNLTGAGSKGYGVSFSPDGKTIATASYSSSPYFTIHRLNTDTGEYEKLQDLTGAGDGGQGVSFSPDSKTVAAASYSSPYFTVHRLNENTGKYEKLQDLAGVGSNGQGVSFSPDGKTIATASSSSPCFTVHNAEPTLKVINFNTPPPEGVVITADYTVPYIPKTEDYVLDVTAEIQFGEGV